MVVQLLLYTPLFCHLSAVLKASNCDKLVIATDNEMSMRNAIQQAFSKATQILCTRHLKQNVEEKLADKCGLDRKKTKTYSRQDIW